MPPSLRRLYESRLYLITPANPGAGTLEAFLPKVLDAGVDIVQLREKDMRSDAMKAPAEIVRRLTHEFGALFVVNDSVDLAVEFDADGVHLGQEDLPASEARQIAGGSFLIGCSTHDPAEIKEAQRSECDYLGVGPLFATPTKPGRAATGLRLLGDARRLSRKPFFAIGGVGVDNIQQVVAAGADRVAVLRAICDADDPAEAARILSSHLSAPRLG